MCISYSFVLLVKVMTSTFNEIYKGVILACEANQSLNIKLTQNKRRSVEENSILLNASFSKYLVAFIALSVPLS